MLANVYEVVLIVAAIVGIGWVFWVMVRGDPARHAEDAARAFFDEHGHWPDETPEQADAERRRLAEAMAASQARISQPGSDGRV